MKTTLLCLLLASGLVSTASAAPLKRSDVPAQPAWVVHVDCDGLRQTQLGQFLLGEMRKPEAQAKFAAFQVIYSFDPRQDLRGLTLYNTGTDSQDGVLIVYASFDPQRLVTLVNAAKDYQSTTYRGLVIHSWIDEKKKDQPRVYAGIYGDRVIFGQRESAVSAALEIILGAPNLATSGAFNQLGDGSAYIQAAARKFELPASAPHSAVLRMCKTVRFELGENQQAVNAALALETGSEEVAGHVASVAQGLLSLIKLRTDQPGAVRLAQATKISQDGVIVAGRAALASSEIIEFLKVEAAKKAAAQRQ